MNRSILSAVVGLMTPVLVSAQSLDPAASSTVTGRCDTIYVGPPGGAWWLAANWTTGLPAPGRVACFRSDTHRPDMADLPDPDLGFTFRTIESSVVAVGKDILGPRPGPPPPTAWGSCCLGSTCTETDAFDCRELGGYFLEGVGPCTQFVCDTGACCTDEPGCVDDDGSGGAMNETLCGIMGGQYLGGAACDVSDPCQRHRIPEGYEILQISYSDAYFHGPPRMNECGQIVFHRLMSRVFLYDNGSLVQVPDTNNHISEQWPDINDDGVIVWTSEGDGFGNGGAQMFVDGQVITLGEGAAVTINNLGHVAWSRYQPDGCFGFMIMFYDGRTVREAFVDPDGRSNIGVAINDSDDLVWTRYDHCTGGLWTSEIMLWSDGMATPLPSSLSQCQGTDMDNAGTVVWNCDDGTELWNGLETVVLSYGHNTAASPRLNELGDIVYNYGTETSPWLAGLYHDGQFSRISSDFDMQNQIHNKGPDITDIGEIAWKSYERGAGPSAIVYMRRIRDGDVDFDGDVDIDDFIPLPECFTGAVPTDRLCECRFFDIDHDRDIDNDDYDLFMRVYSGPMEDCNENSTLDLVDLIEGAAFDCNLNGRPDSCDIDSGFSEDIDGNGVPDECWGVIPTVSHWGLLAMTLLLTTAATVILQRSHRTRPTYVGTPFSEPQARARGRSPCRWRRGRGC